MIISELLDVVLVSGESLFEVAEPFAISQKR